MAVPASKPRSAPSRSLSPTRLGSLSATRLHSAARAMLHLTGATLRSQFTCGQPQKGDSRNVIHKSAADHANIWESLPRIGRARRCGSSILPDRTISRYLRFYRRGQHRCSVPSRSESSPPRRRAELGGAARPPAAASAAPRRSHARREAAVRLPHLPRPLPRDRRASRRPHRRRERTRPGRDLLVRIAGVSRSPGRADADSRPRLERGADV